LTRDYQSQAMTSEVVGHADEAPQPPVDEGIFGSTTTGDPSTARAFVYARVVLIVLRTTALASVTRRRRRSRTSRRAEALARLNLVDGSRTCIVCLDRMTPASMVHIALSASSAKVLCEYMQPRPMRRFVERATAGSREEVRTQALRAMSACPATTAQDIRGMKPGGAENPAGASMSGRKSTTTRRTGRHTHPRGTKGCRRTAHHRRGCRRSSAQSDEAHKRPTSTHEAHAPACWRALAHTRHELPQKSIETWKHRRNALPRLHPLSALVVRPRPRWKRPSRRAGSPGPKSA
jgi:hypothetical protein